MTTPDTIPRTRKFSPRIGAMVFLLLFLSALLITGIVSTGTFPLPGAPADEVGTYLVANTTASLLTGVLQGLSGLGLAIVVAGPLTRTVVPHGSRVLSRVAGWVAVAAILTSAALSIVLGLIAPTASTDVLVGIRDASFYTGGVTHVVALGVFVLSLAASRGQTRPVRITGRIAGTLAVLSLLSLAIFYASALLPIGRVACMVALVIAGVSFARRGALAAAS